MKLRQIVWGILMVGGALPALAQETTPPPVTFTHVNRDIEQVRRLYNKMYVPARDTPEGWQDLGHCNPGSPSPAALKARLTEINYFRIMAGLKPVKLDPDYNRKAQAAAHLMLQNNALSHNPPTTWKCYTKEGAAGASSCNLGFGGGIFGYITDHGSDNQSCGHRMYILRANASVIGYGGTSRTDAIYVFGKSAQHDSLPRYVAWPPAGFIPSEILSDRWTFALPGVYGNFKKAEVTVSIDGTPVPLTYVQPTSYGDGGVSFEIADWYIWKSKMIDQRVKVQIQNVVVGDEIRAYTYEVIAFPAGEKATSVTNTVASYDAAEEEEETEAEVLPFADRKPMSLAEFHMAAELPGMVIERLRLLVARDLVADAAVSKFAARISGIRKDKNPDAERLTTWAQGKIKQHLAHQKGLDEAQTAAALAPKFVLLEFKQLVPMGTETYGEIAKELAAKFVAQPELKAFALKYKRIRQCGVGFAVKQVVRDGQTYAGVYATLVLSPAALTLAG